ncbi:CDP-alcohol phosphatidyltransferase family protein [Micromonospora sp. 15K316]|uniref:CDP-alcohol phosphatidyltransferase family protein n=1 Tax=Micromonospora sp. 15K316 TaxID=2530376 RepID=UPI001044D539|nr:CDP-alcohol phosphatidyltransferase family protein [Micromonospora sp. 15K316]
MRTVRTGPLVGLVFQVVVLAVLAGTVGLGGAGWLAGVTYGLLSGVALTRGMRRAGTGRLGPADRVTLTRSTLVGGVTALAADAITRPAPVGLLVTLSAVALLLDAVDGRVARRTGTASALGARFDMEVDAFLLLVLSVYVAPYAGPWVLAIGGMRYAFVAAGWVLPWMRGTLPPRQWRKVVAATQGIVLTAAALLPGALTTLLLVAALALLVESFGRDVRWLWRHRPPAPGSRPALPAPAQREERPARTPALAGSRSDGWI